MTDVSVPEMIQEMQTWMNSGVLVTAQRTVNTSIRWMNCSEAIASPIRQGVDNENYIDVVDSRSYSGGRPADVGGYGSVLLRVRSRDSYRVIWKQRRVMAVKLFPVKWIRGQAI